MLIHHAAAAAAITVPWLITASLLAPSIPPAMTLLVIILLVLPGVALWQIRRRLRLEGIRTPAAVRARLGLRVPRMREILQVGLPALAAALLLPGLVVWTEPLIRSALSVPSQLSTGWPDTSTIGPTATAGLLVLWFVVAVVVGPVIEELLFRGLLQPLISGSKTRRVLIGTLLFTIYHLWQPWAWPAVFLATLPVAWVRERSASIPLAAGVHVLANATAWMLLLNGLMQR